MIKTNGGSYYPPYYGSAPSNGISNHYGVGPAPIPPFYNPTYPQQKPSHHPINEQNNENFSSFKLYDVERNNRSEIIRLIFAYVDVAYKEKRLKQNEWDKIKEQMPVDQLPILRINNHYKIYHLYAILRHLAREFNLYGIGKHDHAIVDIVLETIRPLSEKIYEQLKISTDYEQTIRQIIIDDSTIYLKQLENFYQLFNHQGPFYLGLHISLADLIVYDTISHFIKIDRKFLENYPHLKEARRRLEKHPGISNYVKTNISHQRKRSHPTSAPSSRQRTKSPTPIVTSDHHRHRSHDEQKSTHRHYHCRYCHHRLHHHHHHSKEPTPIIQTNQRSSESPSISKKINNQHHYEQIPQLLLKKNLNLPLTNSSEKNKRFFFIN